VSEDRLFKCDENKEPIPGMYAVIEDSRTTEYYVYFSGNDIPKLDLNRGDYVYLIKGEFENQIKLFLVDLFIDNTMIQCTIPPVDD
jgi:hypothetical protein